MFEGDAALRDIPFEKYSAMRHSCKIQTINPVSMGHHQG